jgi:hypothetical protein
LRKVAQTEPKAVSSWSVGYALDTSFSGDR